MESLQDIIRSIKKQNESIQSTFGLASLKDLAATIANQRQTQFNFSALSGLTDIAQVISQQIKPDNGIASFLGSSVQANLAAMEFVKHDIPFSGLTLTLAEIAKTSKLVSDQLSGFAASQIFLSSSLSEIAKQLNQSHLSKFNSINFAVQGISSAYLKDIALTHAWEDISVAEEANETIANIADELLSNSTQVTVQDLDNLRQSIISELFGLLGKTKTDKARQFILDLMTVVGFLLTLYFGCQSYSDKSNKEVIAETKIELEKISKEFSEKIEFELNKLNRTRIARTNLKLINRDTKNGKVIGLVKTGQRVTVIEIRHKYLLISYIDIETGEPKSGFVIKKYFDIEKSK